MKASEILAATEKTLGSIEAWTQGCSARNLKGGEVSFCDKSAACFCLWGAICKNLPTGNHFEIIKTYFAPLWGDVAIGPYNDTHTYEEIMAVLAKAKEAAISAGD